MSKTTKLDTPNTGPLIAGTLGGAVSTILLYPLDLIKVRLQVYESTDNTNNNSTTKNNARTNATSAQQVLPGGSSTSFKVSKKKGGTTMNNIIRGIVRHEGISGLYNGLTPAIVGSAASWGGYFFFYEAIKSQMLKQKKQKHKQAIIIRQDLEINDKKNSVNLHELNKLKLGPMENFTAACVSGAILVGFTNPIWLIKTRMQLQINISQEQEIILSQMKNASTEEIKRPYKNMIDAGRTIVKEEGFTSLYKGAGPALMLVSHGGVQFVCYEFLKGHFGEYKKATRTSYGKGSYSSTNSVLHRLEDSIGYLTMGAMSKIVATTMTYPLQVIKSRLQQRSQTTELSESGKVVIVNRQYNGVIDCVKRIWVNEGILGFFKGCLPNAIRVAPSAAITFVVYESVIDMMTK